jgi:hypothetical protein
VGVSYRLLRWAVEVVWGAGSVSIAECGNAIDFNISQE